jgi:hypothetical protein
MHRDGDDRSQKEEQKDRMKTAKSKREGREREREVARCPKVPFAWVLIFL